jgi:hypothetical protein
LYKIIFLIFLLCITNSKGESGKSVVNEINANTSSHFIFDVVTDIESDLELDLDLSITNVVKNPLIIQLSYLSKYSRKTHISLLNNKFQYLRPRAPPFVMV